MNFLTDPWNWWIVPFLDNGFMRTTLLAALLAVITTAVVGTWVVLRGASFIGDALAHGVLPGIALAFILGISTTIGAFAAAILMVLGIAFIRSRSPLPEDASIGILFVGFLALAVVIVSSDGGGYAGDLNRFLFGSVTSATTDSIARQMVAAAIVVAATIVFYRAFLVLTFDETQADLLGLRPRLANIGLLVLIAISIVSSFETIGSLLVMAFLIAPPATAALMVRRVPAMMIAAIVIGALSATIGILISFHAGTAAGATMALVAVAAFFVVLISRSVLGA